MSRLFYFCDMKNILLTLVTLLLFSCTVTRSSFSPQTETPLIKTAVETLASDEFMGRETGTEGERLAGDYIISELKKIGLKPIEGLPEYRQPFPFTANPHFDASKGHPTGENIGNNIVALLDKGSEEYIVLGGHYDHLGMGGPFSLEPDIHAVHNGADDNASGIAAILSILRRLDKEKLNHNILFVGFSGEEFGLWGSKHFVANLPIQKEKIKCMINLDMVGRLSAEKELVISGTGTTPNWTDILNRANEDIRLQVILKESGTGPSDHSVFYRADIPVLAFFTGQHSDYHKPSDDADKVNYEGIEQIAQLITQTIRLTDKAGSLEFTPTKEEETKKMDFKVTLGITPDYVYQGKGLRIDGVRPDRPADNAGIIADDVIIKIGDVDINDIYDYIKVLGMFEPGQSTNAVVIREGQTLNLPLTF